MTKELVISANRHETKVAISEDDQLVEVYFQRANEYSLAGSIHKGRVTRVLPGMQSAFVDLGLERDTFLYVTDFFEENEEYDPIPAGNIPASVPERAPRVPRLAPLERMPIEAPADEENGTAVEAPKPFAERTSEREPAVERGAAAGAEERDESGGRGGRRGRRRRNRGRGFPDSKYASVGQGGAEEPTAAVSPTPAPDRLAAPEPPPFFERSTVPPAESGDYEFPVLPGESLAKYTRSRADEEDHPEVSPIEAETAQEQHPPVETHASAGASLALEAEEEFEAEPLSLAEEVIAESDLVETELAETEIAEADLAEAGAAEPEEAEAEEEGETEEASAQPVEGAEAPTSVGTEAPQTAELREQGGRYQHRVNRRTRRKTRGGADARRGEAAEPAAAARPESPRPARMERPERVERAERSDKPATPNITELLKEGQEILVQIAKEPLGQKGARITSHIALPGRYVVYMPTLDHMGVSRKIASDEERLRLKRILQAHRGGLTGGYIVRTAGEGKSEEDIAADMQFLYNLWSDIRDKAEKRPAPLLLHHDLDIVQRILRDQLTESFKAVWVDNEELYESVLRFVQRFQPTLVSRVKLYTRPEPIFDAFSITQELEKALRPKVWLKSGGYIVINQTEALVAVDVNTGKYVGRSNRLEDTIVKTNTEAVKEIVRQIRLRDLGGIIVVDFIDMDERKNRQKVMQALEEAMRSDKAPNKILQFNDFGLVAITRKRVKQSLERTLCAPCPYCEGAGYVKSVQTIIGEILQEAFKIASALEGKNVVLRVHPDVAKIIKSNQNKYLEELEEIVRKSVLVKGDPSLHHEKFDLG